MVMLLMLILALIMLHGNEDANHNDSGAIDNEGYDFKTQMDNYI